MKRLNICNLYIHRLKTQSNLFAEEHFTCNSRIENKFLVFSAVEVAIASSTPLSKSTCADDIFLSLQ